MNKVLQSVLLIVVSLGIAFAFVGCNERVRSSDEIGVLAQDMYTIYSTYFDDNQDFQVSYSQSVQTAINEDARAKVLTEYLLPIAKTSFAFYNLTKSTINDEAWSDDDRTSTYNGLNSVKNALEALENAKSRLENAFSGYTGGEFTNIQYSNLTNFIKEYGDFVADLQAFTSNYIEAYYKSVDPYFYEYNGTDDVDANHLKIILADKAFSIAKVSYQLEYKEYFDVDTASFSTTVASGNTTKLCLEMNKVLALSANATQTITQATQKLEYEDINNSQANYNAQINVFMDALDKFNFERLRNSEETEQAYVQSLSYAQQKIYNQIMYVAYTYIPQVVFEYQNAFACFK